MDYTKAPIELLEVSNYLQKIMKKKIGNFNGDKALYFYGEDAKNSLLRFEYFNYVSSFDNEKQNTDPDHQFLPAIECVEDAENILAKLLENNIIQAVIVEEGVSRSILPVVTPKLESTNTFELDQYYVWNYINTMENKVKIFLILCVAAVFTVISLIFSSFYNKIDHKHHGMYDFVLALVETIIYIVGMGGLFLLIRFVVFEVTKKMWNDRGLMLLPDLFADCSFKERFIPVYQYSEAKLKRLE